MWQQEKFLVEPRGKNGASFNLFCSLFAFSATDRIAAAQEESSCPLIFSANSITLPATFHDIIK